MAATTDAAPTELPSIPAPARGRLIGNLGSPERAAIDAHGLVTPVGAGWSLDWWVGAEDRWHVPSASASVRQRLIDDAPVVHTAMRVPGGDVIHRAYAFNDRELGSCALVEVENRSAIPVAVALSVRPFAAARSKRASRVDLDGSTVFVDGRPAAVFSRTPAQSVVLDGDVPIDSEALATFVFPVAHIAVLRVVLPLGELLGAATKSALTFPDSIPAAEQVAKGWHVHADRGLRIEVPDQGLHSSVQAAKCDLLLAAEAPDPKDARESREVREALELWNLHAEPSADDSLLSKAVALVRAKRRKPSSDSAGGTFSDAAAAARFLSSLRDLLVREGDSNLELCAFFPAEWMGQSLEVHGAPTSFGLLSFAVRWHGSRPALLWELVGEADRDRSVPVRLRVPGLDPAWSSTEPKGEALLNGPPT